MTVTEELEAIRQEAGGILRAEDVVEYAKAPETALHGRFQWDDTEAARQYRIWQAREIIRVEVTVLPNTTKETRAYVSMLSDRGEGGGYRDIYSVMHDPEMRSALLVQALAELNRLRVKYRLLKELAPVFEAMDKVPAAAGM